jgi:hypothetical protein
MRSLFIPLVTVGLVASSVIGCSKESKTTAPSSTVQSSKLLEEPLLKKLPTTAVGFLVFDLQGEGYKKLKTSPWFNDMPFQSAMAELERAGADAEQKKVVEALVQFLKKLGAISPDGKSNIEQVVGSLVVVADKPAATPDELDVAAYISAAGATNLKDKLPVLRDALREIGASVSDDKVGGADAFAALLPGSDEEGRERKEITLHVGASEKLLGVSDNKALIEDLFATQERNGIESIKALPEFKRAEAAVRGSEAPLFLGFVSTGKILPTVNTKPAAKLKAKVAEVNVSDTEGEEDQEDAGEAAADEDFDPKDLPVDALMISQGIDQGVVTRAGVAMTAKTDNQRTILDALSAGSLPTSAKSFPADMALALALDTKSIAKLEPLLKNLEQTGVVPALPQIKALKGLTMGVRNNDGGSPIPELVFALESDNRDELATILESALSEGLKSTGQEAMWMSKDIAGSPTRYFTTLLGVGLFISKPASSNTLILTSSERAVKDLLGSSSSVPKLQLSSVSENKTGSLYLNFSELANVMDSVKSSLAMFTGGASDIDKALDSSKLRGMGVSSSTLGYQDGVFVIESTLVQPAAK